jgi:sirohydrochlorin ferrochelatase
LGAAPTTGDRPTLLAVAHGTEDARGRAVVAELVALVASLRPGLDVRLSWLDHAEPTVHEVAEAAVRPLVAVPLLLSAGYHVRHDLPKAVAGAKVEVAIAHRLGPHPLLVDALAARLAEAGWAGGPARLVLAAAGSSHPAARDDVDELAALVAARYGLPVTVAFAAAEPAIGAEVEAARAGADGLPVVVVNYLLSPGQFADKVAACKADVVGAPLGAHPAVARLVLERYDAAVTGTSEYRQSEPATPTIIGS